MSDFPSLHEKNRSLEHALLTSSMTKTASGLRRQIERKRSMLLITLPGINQVLCTLIFNEEDITLEEKLRIIFRFWIK